MKASIIIPAHNNFIEVITCCKSIRKNTLADHEIILVTGEDNPNFAELHAYCDKLIRTKNFFVFSNRINLGIDASVGDYICLLNADTIVEEGWLQKSIDADKKLGEGLVGVRCQVGGGANYDAHGDGEAKYTYSTLNMYGLVMSRRTYNIIGQLDERFVHYGGEDDDYSLRALRHGFPLIVSSGKLYHSVGCGFDPVKVQQLLPKTKIVFMNKWGVELPVPPTQNWCDEERTEVTEPLVSIVIPTRNHEEYIVDCIYSILKQTYHKTQIIVGVDGDDQPKTMKKLLEISALLKGELVEPGVSKLLILKTNEQVGSCDMRNRCVEKATGQFIALHDSDDLMLPNRIESSLEVFKKNPSTDIVYTDFLLQKASGELHEKNCGEPDIEKLKSQETCMPGGTFMMRRYCPMEEVFSQEHERAFDFEYYLRTHKKFNFRYLPESTIVYRRHAGEHLSGNNESVAMHEKLVRGHNGE